VVPDRSARVVSVQPAVSGIDRTFDYLVPDDMDQAVRVGTVVRADLSGRRVGGWVVADGVEPPDGLALRPLTRVTGWGPSTDVVDLTAWGAWRWAGRRAALLASASADGAVNILPTADLRPPASPGDLGEVAGLVSEACARPVGIVELPPAADVTALVALVAQRGPTLVIVPSMQRASILAGRLRRAGAGVAELPRGWARARAGAGVVIGSRAAVWAPCPGLAAIIVLDAHDEGLVQEQAPTWWATVVAAERAKRAGVPCLLITPCPTLDLLAIGWAVAPSVAAARRGWAPLEIVDRRADDPRLGLYSERLVHELHASSRAVCVLNRTGRARLLACGACGELARCERCGAALAQATNDEASPPASAASAPASRVSAPASWASAAASLVSRSASRASARAGAPASLVSGRTGGRVSLSASHALVCGRCGASRPPVCAACDSTRLRQLRVGVTRVREELEALIGQPVGEVTATRSDRPDAAVVVGTEAVFHQLASADLVAFLDFDQELLAPRFRAADEALALLARAARLVGGRRRSGRVLVQVRTPDHPALRAALSADPSLLTHDEADLRRLLALPPSRAYAAVTGPGAAELVAGVPADAGVEVIGPTGDRWLLRAASSAPICDMLAGVERPAGRVRIEVDPLRL
jgi:primosomal protein N' (replication factor Y)